MSTGRSLAARFLLTPPAIPNANLSAEYTTDTATLTLTWQDVLTDESAYRVESQPTTNAKASTWEIEETLAATEGQGSAYTWLRSTSENRRYRVVSLRPSGDAVLSTASGAAALTVDPALGASIALDQNEPLVGSVQLSIQSVVGTPKSVTYFVDTRELTTGTVGPQFPATWSTRAWGNGSHLLNARIRFGADNYVLIKRTVEVANPNLNANLQIKGAGGVVRAVVTAASDTAITNVTFYLDDAQTLSLSQKNGCANPDECEFEGDADAYIWEWDTRTATAGTHTVSAVVTDAHAESLTLTKNFEVNNYPRIHLTTPEQWSIVGAQLQISGQVDDDQPDPKITVTLGDITVLKSSGNNFSVSYDLSGLPEGTYTLKISARDAGNNLSSLSTPIIYAPLAAAQFERLLSLGAGGELLDSRDGKILYRNSNREIRLRQFDGSESLITNLDSEFGASGFQIAGTRVVWSSRPPENNFARLRVWNAGVITDQGPANAASINPVAKWPFVAWSTPDSLRVRNLETGTESLINRQSGQSLGSDGFDLQANSNGSATVFYWASMPPPGGGPSEQSVYSYNTATATSTKLSADGNHDTQASTNGSSVVWQRKLSDGAKQLVHAAYSTPTLQSILSPAFNSFHGAKGSLVVWSEPLGDSTQIKIRSSDGSIHAVEPVPGSTTVQSVGGHSALIWHQNKTKIWSDGALTEVLPVLVKGRLDENRAYLIVSTDQVLYRQKQAQLPP